MISIMKKIKRISARFLQVWPGALVAIGFLICGGSVEMVVAQQQPLTTVGASWPGIPSDFTLEPPDPHGAAGPNGIMQVVNTRIEYWTKSGTPIWGPRSLQSFFGRPGNAFQSDCKARFDPVTGRFYVLILDLDFNNEHSYIDFA